MTFSLQTLARCRRGYTKIHTENTPHLYGQLRSSWANTIGRLSPTRFSRTRTTLHLQTPPSGRARTSMARRPCTHPVQNDEQKSQQNARHATATAERNRERSGCASSSGNSREMTVAVGLVLITETFVNRLHVGEDAFPVRLVTHQ